MRIGIPVLVTFGLVGLALVAGYADDQFDSRRFNFNPPQADRSNDYFARTGEDETAQKAADTQPQSRYTRQPADGRQTLRVKNYYKELFGQSGPDRKTAAAPETPAAEGGRNANRGPVAPWAGAGSGRTGARRDANVAPAGYQAPGQVPPNRSARRVGPPRPSPETPAGKERAAGGVVQADYRRGANSSHQGEIRQIEGRDDSPFRDPSEIDAEAAEAQDRSTAKPPRPERRRGTVSEIRRKKPAKPAVPAAARPATSTRRTALNAAPRTLKNTPSVSVEWVKKSEINIGQECQCDLVVKNSGKTDASDITVEAYFPPTVRLTSAEPVPSEHQDHLSWSMQQLAAGEEKAIHITMIPSQRGDLSTKAVVHFTGSAMGLFTVVEPMLKVDLRGPAEVMVGDPASQIVLVSNPGTGVAKNVSIEARIPAGLEHPRGERILMSIGSLNPGETRSVRLALAAAQGGDHNLQVEAKADTNLVRSADAKIKVIAPSLSVKIDGPSLRYVGRKGTYTVAVTNDGAAASNNVRVLHQIPDGFRFVRSDRGGKVADRSIEWFVGRLEPGESTQIKLTLEAVTLGDFVHHVEAVSEHGARSENDLSTAVEGTASLVLDILDLNDPVEIGSETAYEVRVKNEGSKAAQNVGLSCELPQGVRLVRAKGPAESISENGLVVFKSLSSLGPGKAAIYQVYVRGVEPGNHRFRVRLASDSIQEPLIFEELTKFYGD